MQVSRFIDYISSYLIVRFLGGGLGTIAESDNAAAAADTPIDDQRAAQGPPPRSSKSVRFAAQLPPDDESQLGGGYDDGGEIGGEGELRSTSGNDVSLSVNLPTTVGAQGHGMYLWVNLVI